MRFLLGLLLVLTGVGCAPSPESDAVRIAVSCPTGFNTGLEMLAGIELALREVGGEVQGRRVELRVFDVSDRSQPLRLSEEAEVRAAREAAADPSVLGYIGPLFSGPAKLSIPILNQAGVPQISPAASWPGLTRSGFEPGEPGVYYPTGRRTFYRVITNDERQVVAAADWAFAMGFRRFYILEAESAYARGMAGIFRERILDFEAAVVGHDRLSEYPTTAGELQEYPAKVATAKPDMLFFSGDFQSQGAIDNFQVLEAIRRRLPEVAVMTPETLSNRVLLERTGDALKEGVYGVSGAIPPPHLGTIQSERFRENFEKTFGRKPGALGSLAYEAALVLLEGMENAASLDRESILGALDQLGTPKGVLTDWRLDAAGDRTGTGVAGYSVQHGQWTFTQILD
jgi:branched-chain amino acid transport system substrate-binding protein